MSFGDDVFDPVFATKPTVKDDRHARTGTATSATTTSHARITQQPVPVVPGLPMLQKKVKQQTEDPLRKQDVPPPALLPSSWGPSAATTNLPMMFHPTSTTASTLPLPASLSSFRPRHGLNDGDSNATKMLSQQQMLSSWGYGRHQQQMIISGPNPQAFCRGTGAWHLRGGKIAHQPFSW